MIRFCIISPLYTVFNYTPSLSNGAFFLLILSTVCIAAAGYLINDYFDVAADAINKPKQNLIGSTFSQTMALKMYGVLNGIGVLLGFYLAHQIGHFSLGFLHVVIVILLWFYSTHFKKQPLIGNIVVAGLLALVVLIVLLYENELHFYLFFQTKIWWQEWLTGKSIPLEATDADLKQLLVNYILGYALFAFLLNFIREIIKDLEDMRGDAQMGYHTLPLFWSIEAAKFIAVLTTVATMYFILSFQAQQYQLGQHFTVLAAIVCVQLPLGYLIWTLRIWEQTNKTDYSKLSKLLKIVMLAGLLYLGYFRWTMDLTPMLEGEPVEMEWEERGE